MMKSLQLIAFFVLLSESVLAETAVQLLPLSPPLNAPKAEFSGLAWCGDELVLLPQRPRENGPVGLKLYVIDKKAILNAVKNPGVGALQHREINLDDQSFRASFPHFDGYEAIVCREDQLWLAVEARVGKKYFYTAIVRAEWESDSSVKVDQYPLVTFDSSSGIWNMSNETLVLGNDSLISIHESNAGQEWATAAVFLLTDNSKTEIAFPRLPFRVTDATELDSENRFWVINYLWRGDPILQFDQDWIADKHPPGRTHKLEKNLERLIELELTGSGIVVTDTPPVYLELTQEDGRNWEGIVRLDDLGFLVVTDQYPETYFGFVPLR